MQFEKSFNEEAKWGNTMVEFGVRFEQIRIFESKAIPNTDAKNIIYFNFNKQINYSPRKLFFGSWNLMIGTFAKNIVCVL